MMNIDDSFINFLKVIWKDNTLDEAKHLWIWQITNFPDAAKNYLDALGFTLKTPPENFIELIQENGWIFLNHEDDEGNITSFTF